MRRNSTRRGEKWKRIIYEDLLRVIYKEREDQREGDKLHNLSLTKCRS